MPELISTYSCPDGTDFPVRWADPQDAQSMWGWDQQHCPNPLTPLSIDFVKRAFAEPDFVHFWAYFWRSTPGQTVRQVFPQGYQYFLRYQPATGEPPHPVVEERMRRMAGLAPRTRRIWEKDCVPRIQAICHQLQQDSYESMSLSELTSLLEPSMNSAAQAFALTFVPAGPMFECSRPLVMLCQEEYGPEGEAMAGVMMEGFTNDSSSSNTALWDLSEWAGSLPAVARVFRSHDTNDLLDSLPAVDGGTRFIEAFSSYLDRYGWRPEIWFELSLPTWRDDPRPALSLVQRYISGQDSDPHKALARSARRRRQMVQRVEARLRGNPDRLRLFRSILAISRQYVPVREGRAFWQLTSGGSLRVPCLALGAKIRDAGLLADAEDLFYLRLNEIQEMVTDPSTADWKGLVAERRADRQRWMSVTPPAAIGAGTAPMAATPLAEDRVLRGNAASAGVVQGPAKVVRTLGQADRVERGDILVCRATSPAWTPLFARVAAVVTESGGVLSHSAIVAREHAIPCVVGVRGATELIRDGTLITVDGGQGTVRLEG